MHYDIKNTLVRCTKDASIYRISGSDVALFIKSPFSLYCKNFVDHSEMDPYDYSQDLFTRHGHDYEDRLLNKKYPDVPHKKHIRKKQTYHTQRNPDKTRARNLQKTLRRMYDGVESLLEPQLCFLPWGMHGSPDILERRVGESDFGEYHYIIKEIKSSRKIKRGHIMQAAFYNMMLGEIQGHIPDIFHLLNGAGDDMEYSYELYREDLADILTKIIKIKEGFMPPALYGRGIFPWSNYCDKTAMHNDDLSLISRMEDSTRRTLEQNGINTITKLLNYNAEGLIKLKIKPEIAYYCITKATALKTGDVVGFRDAAPISSTANAIFLRLDEGLNGEPYMLGMLIRNKESEEYLPFVVEGPGQHHKLLSKFLLRLKDISDFEIYYWGSDGETPITKLAQKQDDTDIQVPMINLQSLANGTVAFPTYRDRLKLVSEWVGFKWSDADAEWGKGVLMYTRYIQDVTRRACLDYIVTYNRDSCLAMAAILDWLIKHGYLRRA
ncbi:MAG: TM0106 family RecB-like putative nuclease [Cenarchaeum sp. SB0665_bin_23]|nr:TM0106 family RecB-like putative nuclease [Cenarchaeum sp. SB0665_bin_23]MYG32420.1 TM0106 family RecB-like putative nuclease [Cenarchaeum sp. SB0677_bin_16]